jgi:hypothetical protein
MSPRAVLLLLACCSGTEPLRRCAKDSDCFATSGYKCDTKDTRECRRGCYCDSHCLWGQECSAEGICADAIVEDPDAGAGNAGHCTTTSQGSEACREYVGSAYKAADLEAACTAYASGACPGDGAQGPCVFYRDQPRETRLFLYGVTTDVAKRACEQVCVGLWTP